MGVERFQITEVTFWFIQGHRLLVKFTRNLLLNEYAKDSLKSIIISQIIRQKCSGTFQ